MNWLQPVKNHKLSRDGKLQGGRTCEIIGRNPKTDEGKFRSD